MSRLLSRHPLIPLGRPFNAGPILKQVEPWEDSDEGEGRGEEGLLLLEKVTFSPTIPLPLLGGLPSLHDHHLQNRSRRINSLRFIKCVLRNTEGDVGYWSVVNTDRFVSIPPWRSSSALPLPLASPFTSILPQRLGDSLPYIGFTPTFGASEGFLIAPVRITDDVILNIINSAHGGGYRLELVVATEWHDLEERFIAIIGMLMGPLSHLPPLRQPPLPSSHHYTSIFPTLQVAILKIKAARDAFSLTTTFISFLLSFWRYTDAVYPFTPLMNHCKTHLPTHHAFLHDLVHNTSVGDFRLGTRAGYIVDAASQPSEWIRFVHVWAEAGISLWIYGGGDPSQEKIKSRDLPQSTCEALTDWSPRRETVSDAYDEYLRKIGDTPQPPSMYEQCVVGDAEGLLYGLSHFGFRDGDYTPGDHPGYYFPRRESALRKWRDRRVPSRESSREALDGSHWDPLFYLRPMYVWEEERGFWARRKVPRSLKRAYFETFNPESRRWCPVFLELDLCTFLGDQSIGIARYGNPLSSTSRFAGALSGLRPGLGATTLTQRNATEIDHNLELSAVAAASSEDFRWHPTELRHPISTLAIRLGYDISRPLPEYHKLIRETMFPNGWRTSKAPPPSIGVPRKYIPSLALTPTNSSNAHGETLSDAIADAFYSLSSLGQTFGESGLTYDRSKLPDRWDISPLSERRPKVPDGLAAYSVSHADRKGKVWLRCVVARDDQPLEDQWWMISLSPSALLQVCRSGAQDLEGAARYLIKNGIPFSTAVFSKLNEGPSARPIVRTCLGSMTSDSLSQGVSSLDYAEYEARRDAFLRTRRGSIALRCGGIVWRLAIESADSQSLTDALCGPSQFAEEHGTRCGTMCSGEILVDDALELHELDIILGAYRYRSRNSKNPAEWTEEHCAYLWPTPSAWRKSGMDTGEWSQDAETWFQINLDRLRRGEGRPKSSGGWRGAIKMASSSRGVWSNYDTMVMDGFFS